MTTEFRVPHWGWWVAIIGGMSLTAWIAFSHEGYSWWQGWGISSIPQVIFQWTFWLAVLAHVGEASYAWVLARKLDRHHSLQWGMQTFLLGYPSLRLLKEAA